MVYLYIALVQSLLATFGSLYFSEVLHIPPCILCWYQRILMYPLTVILFVGITKKDKILPYYVLPLSIMGMVVALYHYSLQMGIIPQSIIPCTLGISCATKYFEWFEFITIPFLSFLAFTVITVSMALPLKIGGKKD